MHTTHHMERTATELVDSVIKVHRALGPGMLESAYQSCLGHELERRGVEVRCEVLLPLKFEQLTIAAGYRADMILNNCVIVENKCVSALLPSHTAQLLTYLRLADFRLGFLVNWNSVLVKHGIKRLVNKL